NVSASSASSYRRNAVSPSTASSNRRRARLSVTCAGISATTADCTGESGRWTSAADSAQRPAPASAAILPRAVTPRRQQMTRARGFVLCAALAAGLPRVSTAAQAPADNSKPRTITATIAAIDQASRIVTLKGPNGNTVDVKAPDEMQGFKSLKVG